MAFASLICTHVYLHIRAGCFVLQVKWPPSLYICIVKRRREKLETNLLQGRKLVSTLFVCDERAELFNNFVGNLLYMFGWKITNTSYTTAHGIIIVYFSITLSCIIPSVTLFHQLPTATLSYSRFSIPQNKCHSLAHHKRTRHNGPIWGNPKRARSLSIQSLGQFSMTYSRMCKPA